MVKLALLDAIFEVVEPVAEVLYGEPPAQPVIPNKMASHEGNGVAGHLDVTLMQGEAVGIGWFGHSVLGAVELKVIWRRLLTFQQLRFAVRKAESLMAVRDASCQHNLQSSLEVVRVQGEPYRIDFGWWLLLCL